MDEMASVMSLPEICEKKSFVREKIPVLTMKLGECSGFSIILFTSPSF